MPFMAIICLLLTACDKDEVSPANSMKWSYEILTPANVKFLKSTAEVSPAYFFETNGKGGDMVMTCENFGHSCISPWQYNHVIQRLWTL